VDGKDWGGKKILRVQTRKGRAQKRKKKKKSMSSFYEEVRAETLRLPWPYSRHKARDPASDSHRFRWYVFIYMIYVNDPTIRQSIGTIADDNEAWAFLSFKDKDDGNPFLTKYACEPTGTKNRSVGEHRGGVNMEAFRASMEEFSRQWTWSSETAMLRVLGASNAALPFQALLTHTLRTRVIEQGCIRWMSTYTTGEQRCQHKSILRQFFDQVKVAFLHFHVPSIQDMAGESLYGEGTLGSVIQAYVSIHNSTIRDAVTWKDRQHRYHMMYTMREYTRLFSSLERFHLHQSIMIWLLQKSMIQYEPPLKISESNQELTMFQNLLSVAQINYARDIRGTDALREIKDDLKTKTNPNEVDAIQWQQIQEQEETLLSDARFYMDSFMPISTTVEDLNAGRVLVGTLRTLLEQGMYKTLDPLLLLCVTVAVFYDPRIRIDVKSRAISRFRTFVLQSIRGDARVGERLQIMLSRLYRHWVQNRDITVSDPKEIRQNMSVLLHEAYDYPFLVQGLYGNVSSPTTSRFGFFVATKDNQSYVIEKAPFDMYMRAPSNKTYDTLKRKWDQDPDSVTVKERAKLWAYVRDQFLTTSDTALLTWVQQLVEKEYAKSMLPLHHVQIYERIRDTGGCTIQDFILPLWMFVYREKAVMHTESIGWMEAWSRQCTDLYATMYGAFTMLTNHHYVAKQGGKKLQTATPAFRDNFISICRAFLAHIRATLPEWVKRLRPSDVTMFVDPAALRLDTLNIHEQTDYAQEKVQKLLQWIYYRQWYTLWQIFYADTMRMGEMTWPYWLEFHQQQSTTNSSLNVDNIFHYTYQENGEWLQYHQAQLLHRYIRPTKYHILIKWMQVERARFERSNDKSARDAFLAAARTSGVSSETNMIASLDTISWFQAFRRLHAVYRVANKARNRPWDWCDDLWPFDPSNNWANRDVYDENTKKTTANKHLDAYTDRIAASAQPNSYNAELLWDIQLTSIDANYATELQSIEDILHYTGEFLVKQVTGLNTSDEQKVWAEMHTKANDVEPYKELKTNYGTLYQNIADRYKPAEAAYKLDIADVANKNKLMQILLELAPHYDGRVFDALRGWSEQQTKNTRQENKQEAQEEEEHLYPLRSGWHRDDADLSDFTNLRLVANHVEALQNGMEVDDTGTGSRNR
jgi:hypothetical protein